MKKKIIFLAGLNCFLIIVIISLFIFIQVKEAGNTVSSTSDAVISSQTKENDNNNYDSTEDSNISAESADTNHETEYATENIDEIDEPVQMIFGGDIYLSDYVIDQYNRNGIDGILSDSLQNKINDSEIVMFNEEFPFSNRGTPMKDKQYTFRVMPKYSSVFSDMGIDIVTLANNHILDFGEEALLDSMEILKNSDIDYVGAGSNIDEASVYKEYIVHGKKIAIAAASRVIPVVEWNATKTTPGLLTTYDPTNLLSVIKKAKEVNDIVIVYVHWGIERAERPEEYQRALAKQYIDAGADMIIGSHPHVLQGIEYYNGKPIIYSLGNFMFYNTIERTALIQLEIDTDNKLSISLVPCKAENAKTSEITEDEKQSFYDYITNLSYGIEIDQNGIVQNISIE